MLIRVMGATGSGKSTFINLVSGSDLAVSDSLKSCTSQVQSARSFELSGRSITLVDTPGFDDTLMSDTDVLNMIAAAYLVDRYEQGIKLSGVIYMHRITDRRVGGMSIRNFSMLRKLCGDDTLKNVAIVTNMWNQESKERGIIREQELKTDNLFFKPVMDRGGQMLRHDNTVQSAQDIVSHFVKRNPMPLRIQRELIDEKKDIADTEAGVVLQGELADMQKKHREEIDAIRRDMEKALADKDEQTSKELQQARSELERQLQAVQDEKERLSREYRELKDRADKQIRKLEAENRAEQEARRRAEEEMAKIDPRGGLKPNKLPRKKSEGFLSKIERFFKKPRS
ncbi:P-loop containing nucleoside triphosphate hydrolase protein [Cytidiella melzeri]|nr:P-loop containing nucleoside triphosphate hydrolase protein [Cytidiella melzeri]